MEAKGPAVLTVHFSLPPAFPSVSMTKYLLAEQKAFFGPSSALNLALSLLVTMEAS